MSPALHGTAQSRRGGLCQRLSRSWWRSSTFKGFGTGGCASGKGIYRERSEGLARVWPVSAFLAAPHSVSSCL